MSLLLSDERACAMQHLANSKSQKELMAPLIAQHAGRGGGGARAHVPNALQLKTLNSAQGSHETLSLRSTLAAEVEAPGRTFPKALQLKTLNSAPGNHETLSLRSTLAAEVEAPGRTFPKALAGAVVLVVAMYVLPLAACLGVMPDALDWQLGFFATVAGNVGGPWLSWALVAAAAVSQVGARNPNPKPCGNALRCMGMPGLIGGMS